MDLSFLNLKNLTSGSIGYGYAAVENPQPLMAFKSALLQVTPGFVSQGVIDEIVKAVAAIAIAALSRWVVGLFDKKKNVAVAAPVPVEQKIVLPVEKQPETVTINAQSDGSKEKENPQK